MSRSRGFVSFKQKTAYEMRISDWSSDECSSDLPGQLALGQLPGCGNGLFHGLIQADVSIQIVPKLPVAYAAYRWQAGVQIGPFMQCAHLFNQPQLQHGPITLRSEEHTSELQSLMRISYAVFCLKKKRINKHTKKTDTKLATTTPT